MRRTLAALAVGLSGVAHAAEPPAEDDSRWAVSLTDDVEIRYWVMPTRLLDPADVPVFNYLEQVNRMNAVVSNGRWSVDAQWDEVALFFNQYYLNDVLYKERDLVLDSVPNPLPDSWFAYTTIEKVRVKYETPVGYVALGDSYAAFGRGIALNLNRNVDIDVDTSIQGVKAVWRPGAWDIIAVAGQLNRQQVFQDNPNRDIQGDFRHAIAGVRAERFGLGPADVGGHAVVYDFVQDVGFESGFQELGTAPDVVVGGLTTALYGVGGVDWFFEGDVFGFGKDQPATTVAPADAPGYAAYGSAAFYPGSLVFLVEGKRYLQTQRVNGVLAQELYNVAIAPTLEYERAVTEDSAAALGSNDIWGTRVRMDWAAKPGVFTPYVAMGLHRDLELQGLHFNRTPETIYHPMMGVEWLVGETSAIVNVGHRLDDRDGTDFGADQQTHGDAAIRVPLVGGFQGELNVGVEYFQWGINELQQTDYVEVESGWTIQRGSAVALTWYNDYSTNPLIDSTGNLSDAVYGALELQVKPTSSLTVKLFGGAYKAGIRCSGGQCRSLPGFEGVRVSMVGSF